MSNRINISSGQIRNRSRSNDKQLSNGSNLSEPNQTSQNIQQSNNGLPSAINTTQNINPNPDENIKELEDKLGSALNK